MAKKVLTMLLAKTTPGTHVFEEQERDRARQVFPVVYIKKQAFASPDQPPRQVTVTIEWDEPGAPA